MVGQDLAALNTVPDAIKVIVWIVALLVAGYMIGVGVESWMNREERRDDDHRR
ncbi:MAG: hypothetical protein KJ065_09245 [Anaerolineae bacterium]|nr:hypothetical protein [Anaerolineae bacterium]